jgi:molecular chaperone DnaK
VLLVGGMTPLAAVSGRVERIFGRKPSRGAHPDEAVALGAGAHGALLGSDRDDLVLLDVIPQSLGVRVGNAMAVVIPRNTTCRRAGASSSPPARADQDEVTVENLPGRRRRRARKPPARPLHPRRAAPGPPGSVRIEVGFHVDADGLVSLRSARAVDRARRPPGACRRRAACPTTISAASSPRTARSATS